MLQDVDFEEIWKDWIEYLPERLQNGQEAAMMLNTDYEAQSPTRRELLFQAMLHIVLTQGDAYHIALMVIEDKMTIEHRRLIHELLKRKLDSAHRLSDHVQGIAKYTEAAIWEEESDLRFLANVLAYEKTDEFLETISNYFLKRTGAGFSILPSDILFETHRDIFVKVWTRYFSKAPYQH